jgi:hypothetical protein
MATVASAAASCGVFIALFVGHQIGDHPVQRNADMLAKAMPDDQRLAAGTPAWTGWSACLRHVATYTLAQAVALALTRLVVPFAVTGALGALMVSASTHAVIDRRWLVQIIIRIKRAEDWAQGRYLIDLLCTRAGERQSLLSGYQ